MSSWDHLLIFPSSCPRDQQRQWEVQGGRGQCVEEQCCSVSKHRRGHHPVFLCRAVRGMEEQGCGPEDRRQQGEEARSPEKALLVLRK